MNLPNILTVARIVLIVPFIIFMMKPGFDGYAAALVVFLIASITDFLDGYLARKWNMVSDFGKIMDPIADKALTLSAFFILGITGVVSLLAVIAICIREITVTVARFVAMKKGVVLAAEKSGKVKTVLQIVSISLLLLLYSDVLKFNEVFNTLIDPLIFITIPIFYIMLIITVISGVNFFRNNWFKIQS